MFNHVWLAWVADPGRERGKKFQQLRRTGKPVLQATVQALNRVQRTALIKILSTHRTVATQTLEVEAHVLPTRLRLKQRAQEVITRLSTFPRVHPIHNVIERTKRRCKLNWSYPKFPLAEAMKIMDLEQAQELETIDLRPLKPWRQPVFDKIDIKRDREKAVRKVTALTNILEVATVGDFTPSEDAVSDMVVM